MGFPTTIPLKIIDARHAEHNRYSSKWDRMNLMYEGGCDIEEHASEFLRKRPKEIPDLYQARIDHFTYHNHLGVALDYYAAALFEENPAIEPADAVKLDAEQTIFYDEFASDCDNGKTSVVDKFRQLTVDMMLFGRAAVLVDLPMKKEYATLKEQKDDGALDPYLCRYDPRQVINWSTDAAGNLNWIVITTRTIEAEPLSGSKVIDRWYFFDRTNFARYMREVKPDEKTPDDATASLTAEGAHALSSENMVPVFFKMLPRGLWLGNRAYLPAIDLLNTDNVLSWSLQLAALAMPVIKTSGEYQPSLSEAGFIKLDIGDEFSWAEPEGKSFAHLADRCLSLTEDIYRSCYLTGQARSNAATPAMQSGYSKQQDAMPAKKVLNLLGSEMRNWIQQVYNAVSVAREEEVKWDVRGLEFPEDVPNDDVALANQFLALNVPSDTADKEVYKRVVGIMLRGANPTIIQKIMDEIDKSPTRAELAQTELETRANTLAGVKGAQNPLKLPGDGEAK